MRKLRVYRFGKWLGILLPREVVSPMRTSAGEYLLLIESPGDGYQLMPCDVAFERKLEQAERIFGRYRNALHALACAK